MHINRFSFSSSSLCSLVNYLARRKDSLKIISAGSAARRLFFGGYGAGWFRQVTAAPLAAEGSRNDWLTGIIATFLFLGRSEHDGSWSGQGHGL